LPVWLPARDYTAVTNVDSIHLMNTILVRAAIVGLAGATAYLLGRSIISDLLEEVAAGLT